MDSPFARVKGYSEGTAQRIQKNEWESIDIIDFSTFCPFEAFLP
jgi:hypothetical protein